jgi:hypothetical protein
MALHLKTSIDIDAAPDAVWAVLSDLPAYPGWNPFIREARGELAAGERLDLKMQPEGGRAVRFRPIVLNAEAGRELRWRGRLLAPGVFDGEHRFAIEPTTGGSRLLHEERFTGVLVPLLAKGLRTRTLPAFEQMNEAVRERAEARSERTAG